MKTLIAVDAGSSRAARRRSAMGRALSLILFGTLLAPFADAASTINSTNAFAWSANTGWVNWRGDGMNGAVIGEYVCAGYIYGANVGWINLGSGNPVNHIQYQQNATDFGVNSVADPSQPGYATLRGYAYGANIGWIYFGSLGNPRVAIGTGALDGYAFAANCGWMNLNDLGGHYVQTDSIAPGVDTDGNGLADPWEYTYFGGPGVLPNGDFDGTGQTNLFKYIAGLNPLDGSRFTLSIAPVPGQSGQKNLIFSPRLGDRTYTLKAKTSLSAAAWDPVTVSPPTDVGQQRTLTDTAATGAKKFYRIEITRF